ncbi:hypothetical protein H0H87_010939 [Tephrocybe sp. NHM501043]|nr:hypothetical protein H0H87_010939 [Tephrocybe sp. NHM501043]
MSRGVCGVIMPEPEVIDLTGLSESESEEEELEDVDDEGSEQISSEDDAEIPLDATSRARLLDAIENMSESRLRRVLNDLIDAMPLVEETLIGQLLTLKRKTHDIISRWETCCNCDEEFDMTARRENEECSFHPGELEVDEGEFADWDERCHGPMDSAHNRRECPENFKWTCCDEDGRAEGDDSITPSYSNTLRLRASIASVPETKLREIMVRLVDRSPGFQYAVAKELLAASSSSEVDSSSLRRKRPRSGRRSLDAQLSERPCANCGQHYHDDAISNSCHYHPELSPIVEKF